MAKNLNVIYDYRIKKRLKYSPGSIAILKANKVYSVDDWTNTAFKTVKAEIKSAFYHPQIRRCAYCRKKLNAGGYYNHIDHVLPKSIYYGWMFKPKNLVITCEVCNPLKNDEDTLLLTHSECKFPRRSASITIFNPHFDRWSDHFVIEDGMFICGKNNKGDETIRVCKLYQYNFSVHFSEESEVRPQSAIRRATTRQLKFPKGSVEFESCKKVIEHYKEMI